MRFQRRNLGSLGLDRRDFTSARSLLNRPKSEKGVSPFRTVVFSLISNIDGRLDGVALGDDRDESLPIIVFSKTEEQELVDLQEIALFYWMLKKGGKLERYANLFEGREVYLAIARTGKKGIKGYVDEDIITFKEFGVLTPEKEKNVRIAMRKGG